MFRGFIEQKYDEVISSFTTVRGELRRDIRDLRHLVRDQEKGRAALERYVESIKLQDSQAVFDALCLKHGYFVLLQDEMDRLFAVLHRILQADNNLLKDLQRLMIELHDAQHLPPDVSRVVLKTLNESLKELEKGLDKVLQDLAGIDSATVSSFKLLERESQIATIIAQLRKGLRAYREYRKVGELAYEELKEFEDRFKTGTFAPSSPFDYDHPDKSLHGHMRHLVRELVTATDEVVMLLHEVHADFQRLRLSEEGRATRLSDLSAAHVPSLNVLGAPYQKGGLGYSLDMGHLLDTETEKIESSYKEQLMRVLTESRLFISKAKHTGPG